MAVSKLLFKFDLLILHAEMLASFVPVLEPVLAELEAAASVEQSAALDLPRL